MDVTATYRCLSCGAEIKKECTLFAPISFPFLKKKDKPKTHISSFNSHYIPTPTSGDWSLSAMHVESNNGDNGSILMHIGHICDDTRDERGVAQLIRVSNEK